LIWIEICLPLGERTPRDSPAVNQSKSEEAGLNAAFSGFVPRLTLTASVKGTKQETATPAYEVSQPLSFHRIAGLFPLLLEDKSRSVTFNPTTQFIGQSKT